MAKNQERRGLFQGGAGLALLAGILVVVAGAWFQPALKQYGYWALIQTLAAAAAALAAFVALGWRRPHRLRALTGAASGAAAGHVIGYVLGFFIPLVGDFFRIVVGVLCAALLATAGVYWGGLGKRG